MRVLVVEDERALADGLRRGLDAEGFATDVAYDGNDGFHMATEHEYDAIVLDIMLPGMNGYRVCAALRDVARNPEWRFVREGPTWHGRRVATWPELFKS